MSLPLLPPPLPPPPPLLPLLPPLLLPLLLPLLPLTACQQEGLARQWRIQQPSDQLQPLLAAGGRLMAADAVTADAALMLAAGGWREEPEDEGLLAAAAVPGLDRSGRVRSYLAPYIAFVLRIGATSPVRLQVRLRA